MKPDLTLVSNLNENIFIDEYESSLDWRTYVISHSLEDINSESDIDFSKVDPDDIDYSDFNEPHLKISKYSYPYARLLEMRLSGNYGLQLIEPDKIITKNYCDKCKFKILNCGIGLDRNLQLRCLGENYLGVITPGMKLENEVNE